MTDDSLSFANGSTLRALLRTTPDTNPRILQAPHDHFVLVQQVLLLYPSLNSRCHTVSQPLILVLIYILIIPFIQLLLSRRLR
jgi:hypothetical protein